MENLLSRFYRYVAIDTRSDERHNRCPSTAGQLKLAALLNEELISLGLADVTLDDNGYLTARLPANTDQEVPAIGFIAHMDTAPDFSGKQVKPQLIERYQGGGNCAGQGGGIPQSPRISGAAQLSGTGSDHHRWHHPAGSR